MSAPSVLNIVKVENGWIVCVDTDLNGSRGRRFVFNGSLELGEAIQKLVVSGQLTVPTVEMVEPQDQPF